MKKTYPKPQTNVFSVMSQQLLAGSNGVSANGNSLTFPSGNVERRDASEAASRNSSDWDWED